MENTSKRRKSPKRLSMQMKQAMNRVGTEMTPRAKRVISDATRHNMSLAQIRSRMERGLKVNASEADQAAARSYVPYKLRMEIQRNSRRITKRLNQIANQEMEYADQESALSAAYAEAEAVETAQEMPTAQNATVETVDVSNTMTPANDTFVTVVDASNIKFSVKEKSPAEIESTLAEVARESTKEVVSSEMSSNGFESPERVDRMVSRGGVFVQLSEKIYDRFRRVIALGAMAIAAATAVAQTASRIASENNTPAPQNASEDISARVRAAIDTLSQSAAVKQDTELQQKKEIPVHLKRRAENATKPSLTIGASGYVRGAYNKVDQETKVSYPQLGTTTDFPKHESIYTVAEAAIGVSVDGRLPLGKKNVVKLEGMVVGSTRYMKSEVNGKPESDTLSKIRVPKLILSYEHLCDNGIIAGLAAGSGPLSTSLTEMLNGEYAYLEGSSMNPGSLAYRNMLYGYLVKKNADESVMSVKTGWKGRYEQDDPNVIFNPSYFKGGSALASFGYQKGGFSGDVMGLYAPVNGTWELQANGRYAFSRNWSGNMNIRYLSEEMYDTAVVRADIVARWGKKWSTTFRGMISHTDGKGTREGQETYNYSGGAYVGKSFGKYGTLSVGANYQRTEMEYKSNVPVVRRSETTRDSLMATIGYSYNFGRKTFQKD